MKGSDKKRNELRRYVSACKPYKKRKMIEKEVGVL
jgi:hypothetical protein